MACLRYFAAQNTERLSEKEFKKLGIYTFFKIRLICYELWSILGNKFRQQYGHYGKLRGDYMKISTRGRYALRLMIDIAVNSAARPVSIKDIARRQDISDKYLEQIISVLNNAGFVRSVRGAQGGYTLTKRPDEYTVGMILRLTEGSLSPVACVDDDAAGCSKIENCATNELWKRLNDAINGVVDHVTLADLVAWQNNNAKNYSI